MYVKVVTRKVGANEPKSDEDESEDLDDILGELGDLGDQSDSKEDVDSPVADAGDKECETAVSDAKSQD